MYRCYNTVYQCICMQMYAECMNMQELCIINTMVRLARACPGVPGPARTCPCTDISCACDFSRAIARVQYARIMLDIAEGLFKQVISTITDIIEHQSPEEPNRRRNRSTTKKTTQFDIKDRTRTSSMFDYKLAQQSTQEHS